jgi:hypothetical protein
VASDERTPGEEDAFEAWTYAANCLLYEEDDGTDVNVGSVERPRIVSHAEFVMIDYTKLVMVELGADLDRLRAAARVCHEVARENQASSPGSAREYARAADLCERAAQMVIDYGAASDDGARRRLIAMAEHDTQITALGAVPGVVERAREELRETLAELDQEPDPLDELPTRQYPGASYDEITGRCVVGEGAGGVTAYWTLNTPGVGMENGLILGPPEIGKTSSLRLVLLEAFQQPKFVLWLADPTGRNGYDVDPWPKAADKLATSPREVLTLLREAVRVIESRAKRGRFPDPTTGRRGVLIALEDAHEVFGDNLEATELAERIAVDGGPVSVAMVATTVAPDLAHFGGSLKLRTALSRTNLFPMGPNGLHMAHEIREN